jgi:16S rRNA (guanine527-N7)-methyltransferase
MVSNQEHERFDRTLQASLAALGVDITNGQRELMYRHYQLVVEANTRFNLTRITSPEDAAVKHYADSLSVLKLPDLKRSSTQSVLDIGSGAGFPAVPLAIACPQWNVHAIDGTGKKVRFVTDAVGHLGLTNVRAQHVRAEAKEWGAMAFDLVLLRAVAEFANGIELGARHLTESGRIVLYKTALMTNAEKQAGRQMARRYDLRPLPPVKYRVSAGGETYHRVLLPFSRNAGRDVC